MGREGKVHVLGCGAIGLTLAAHLASEGRAVVAVRTGRDDVAPGVIEVTIHAPCGMLKIAVETVSLSRLEKLEGITVVSAKSHANRAIAAALGAREASGPLVIMQNGIGVENAFAGLAFTPIYRCVLYTTAELISGSEVTFRPVASSPIGVMKGAESGLEGVARALTTGGFPFHAERDIQREIWKKTIINAVFNSICPLLGVDNGIFARDESARALAREIAAECAALAESRGIALGAPEVMEQIERISKSSAGVLISTLQDIKNGRETEMEYLNIELARMAALAQPEIDLGKTALLGKLLLLKSKCVAP